jgi:hypothetical protein
MGACLYARCWNARGLPCYRHWLWCPTDESLMDEHKLMTAPTLLDLVEEPLDQVAVAVE